MILLSKIQFFNSTRAIFPFLQSLKFTGQKEQFLHLICPPEDVNTHLWQLLWWFDGYSWTRKWWSVFQRHQTKPTRKNGGSLCLVRFYLWGFCPRLWFYRAYKIIKKLFLSTFTSSASKAWLCHWSISIPYFLPTSFQSEHFRIFFRQTTRK